MYSPEAILELGALTMVASSTPLVTVAITVEAMVALTEEATTAIAKLVTITGGTGKLSLENHSAVNK